MMDGVGPVADTNSEGTPGVTQEMEHKVNFSCRFSPLFVFTPSSNCFTDAYIFA